ncbi:MAG: hypothetical protein KatS3mg089_0744 [Patescibacteria group bacterium]|nr:MAG: hypothetical protein KatS3mg089_0744 [Patescibacteria group bacterium]
MRKNYLSIKTLLLILSFFLIIYLLIVLFSSPHTEFLRKNLNSSVNPQDKTEFSYFEEMTIPFLRSRKYESKLGELKFLEDNGQYLSYLTSYTSDGLKINALLTIPRGDMPKKGWPAIVFVHGYIPPEQYITNGRSYSAYVDYLARNGFVVLKIDLRGHGDSEGKPGGGYYGSDYVVDTLNAYEALKNADFVNPNAIGMWGHSMAGNILLRSMAVKPDIPAIVIWAGAVYSYVDMQKYGIQDLSYRPPQNMSLLRSKRNELFKKYGSPSAQSIFWRQVAPTSFLSEIKGAIQLHHAVDDAVVNIGYSRDLLTLLEKTAVPHEFFEYESGGHNIEGESFQLAMQRTVDFFKKYLR